jgi:hypothetical protein
MMRLKDDLLDLLLACADGQLATCRRAGATMRR